MVLFQSTFFAATNFSCMLAQLISSFKIEVVLEVLVAVSHDIKLACNHLNFKVSNIQCISCKPKCSQPDFLSSHSRQTE